MVSIRSDDIRGRWGRLIDNLASFIGIEVSGTISGLNINIASGIVVPVISGNTISLTSGLIANQISGTNVNIQSGLIVPVISGNTISLTSGIIAPVISGNTFNIASGITTPQISGININIQSGIVAGIITVSGITTFNGVVTIGAGASGINFNGLQMLPTMGPGQVEIWVSGSTYRAEDKTNGQIFSSGTDATTVIQAGWDRVATASLGGDVLIKRGLYQMVGPLVMSGKCLSTLRGEGREISQLRSVSGQECIRLAVGANSLNIRDLYLTHNNAAQSGGLLVFQGAQLIVYVDDVDFYDFGKNVGNAIQLQATSGVISRVWFKDSFVEGFNTAIRAEVGNTYYINSVEFNDIYANSARNFFTLKSDISGAFHKDTFEGCTFQWTSGAAQVFDYETENSGRVFYGKHIDCMAWDLTSGVQYMMIGSGQDIEMHGCIPTWKISGAGVLATPRDYRIYDKYTSNNGQFLGSGNASTTVYAFAHGLSRTHATNALSPIHVILTPASTQATSGIMIASGGVANINVTFTAAPASGDVRINWWAFH